MLSHSMHIFFIMNNFPGWNGWDNEKRYGNTSRGIMLKNVFFLKKKKTFLNRKAKEAF